MTTEIGSGVLRTMVSVTPSNTLMKKSSIFIIFLMGISLLSISGAYSLSVADSTSSVSAESRDQVDPQQKNRTLEADDLYKKAFDLYKTGQLIEAKAAFLEVEEKIPAYKAARSYLQKIDDEIEILVKSQRKENHLKAQQAELTRLQVARDQAEQLYIEAMVAYDSKEFVIAKTRFFDVQAVFPEYKKTDYYLSRIDEDIRKQNDILARQAQEKLAKDVYDQAVALYQSEQFEDAKEKFRDVAGILSDYQHTEVYLDRIDDDIIRKKEKALNDVRQRQADVLYNQAVSLYQSQDYEAAKERFFELGAVMFSYKDADQYLKNIDADIVRKRKEEEQRLKALAAEEIYAQAIAFYKMGDLESAKQKFIRTEIAYPDYKDVNKYLSSIDKEIQLKKRDAALIEQALSAEGPYLQAVELHKAQEYAEAKKKFLQVQIIYPAYKETLSYLKRIDEDTLHLERRIAKEEEARRLEALYVQATALYNDRQFVQAKAKFQEASAINPQYKNLFVFLLYIDKDIRDEQLRIDRLTKEALVEGPYAQAVELYHSQDFVAAKAKFREVARIMADYKKTRRYLSKVDHDIRAKRSELDRLRREKAEGLYQQAIVLLDKGAASEAYQKFSELEAVYSDYKAVRRYLVKARKLMEEPIAVADAAQEVKKDDPVKPIKIVKAAKPAKAAKPVKAIVQASKDEEILSLYKKAVAFYKAKDHDSARITFKQVEELRAKYRSTRKYLQLIDAAQAALEEARRLEALYVQATALYNDRQFVQAKAKFQEASAINPQYKNLFVFLLSIDKDIRDEQLRIDRLAKEALVEGPYTQAVELYHSQDFVAAKAKFREVARIMADYKKTRSYLSKVDQDIRAKKSELDRLRREKAEGLYQQAIVLLDKGEASEAYQKFSELEAVYSDYKAVRRYLVKARKLMEEPIAVADAAQEVKKDDPVKPIKIVKTAKPAKAAKPVKAIVEASKDEEISSLYKKEKAVVQASFKANKEAPSVELSKSQQHEAAMKKADPIYVEAVQLYKQKQYDAATAKFADVQNIVPDYKSTRRYLSLIETGKEKESLAQDKSQIAEQHKALKVLTDRSKDLYRQIQKMSDQKELAATARTFSRVGKVLTDLEVEQANLAADLANKLAKEEATKQAEIQERARQAEQESNARQKRVLEEQKELADQKQREQAEELLQKQTEEENKKRELKLQDEAREREQREQERALQDKTEQLYRQAVASYQSKDYSKARELMAEVLKSVPGYKDGARYLLRIDRAEIDERSAQADKIDKQEIDRLVKKAEEVNLEALALSKARDFAGVQQKFTDLEGILQNIQDVKNRMQERHEQEAVERNLKNGAKPEMPQVLLKRLKNLETPKADETDSQLAKRLLREGQQFYRAGRYAQAKVKFEDSMRADNNLKAAHTYWVRVDRILERRDFEQQRGQEKNADQEHVRRPIVPDEMIVPVNAEQQKLDEARAVIIYEEGISLFKVKRYREASIKFEEVSKIADARLRKKAVRYLELTETGLANEKARAQQEVEDQQRRYLQEKRQQDLFPQEFKRQKLQEIKHQDQLKYDEARLKNEARIAELESEKIEAKKRAEMLKKEASANKRADRQQLRQDARNRRLIKKVKAPNLEKGEITPLPSNFAPQQPAVVEEQLPVVKEANEGQDVGVVKEVFTKVQSVKEDIATKKASEVKSLLSASAQSVVTEVKASESASGKITEKRRVMPISGLDRRDEQKLRKLLALERALAAQEQRAHRALEREKRLVSRTEVPSPRNLAAQFKEKPFKKISVSEPVAKPAALPVIPGVKKPVVKVVKSVKKPVVKPVKAPVVKVVKTPVVEPVKEPVVQVVKQPVLSESEKAELLLQKENQQLLQDAADSERRLLEKQKSLIRKDFEDGVERLYKEAISLYNKRLYEEAVSSFQGVDSLISGYKRTKYYLDKLHKRELQKTAPIVPELTPNRNVIIADALSTLEVTAAQ